MRVKNRYLLCVLSFDDGQVDQSFGSAVIYRALAQTLESQWGDYGAGCLASSLSVKYYNALTGLVIARASRDHYRLLWSVLKATRKIKGRPCTLTCVHVGGTIRACQQAALSHSRALLLALDQARAAPQPAVATLNAETGAPVTPAAAAAAAAAGTRVETVRSVTAGTVLVASAAPGEDAAEFRSAALAKEMVNAEKEIMEIDAHK